MFPKVAERKMNAKAYLRVSGRGQVEGDGFPRQKAAIKAYADAHGVRISRYFQEEGVSGTKDLENRPALTELMLALHSNGVTTVIVEKLDRLARDLMIQETIVADLRKSGFTLISVAEPDLCSDDPSRKLVRQIFGAISEYERAMIVLKLKASRQRMRAKTGRCEGRKPYGTREGERDVIGRIVEFHKNGLNYSEIAAKLNALGIKARSGGVWFPANVCRILSREA
jgi:DNA invertase Pin-like site-specific DNA recombinase